MGQNAHAKILFGLRGAKCPCGAKSPPWGKNDGNFETHMIHIELKYKVTKISEFEVENLNRSTVFKWKMSFYFYSQEGVNEGLSHFQKKL